MLPSVNLLEETGITADEYEYLGPFYPSCAYSDEVIHMYLAKSLYYGERSLDDDEFLNVGLMPLEELVSMIMNGEVPDGKTQAAVMRVWSGLNQSRKTALTSGKSYNLWLKAVTDFKNL